MLNNPLHAAHYADAALQASAFIEENVAIAKDTFRVRFRCPEMAERFLPGQFLMMRLTGFQDPLIGRAFALYDTIDDEQGRPGSIDIVYLVKGKLTTALAELQAGQQVDVWGPLGNGFAPTPVDHLVMAAGGIGQTPFLAVAKERLGIRRYGRPPREVARVQKITLCYGARSADLHAGVDDFRQAGIEVRLATEDGTAGRHGLVTDELREVLRETTGNVHVLCCGPEPMMEAAAEVAAEFDAPCQVSLETPMACGIGICFTCVAKVKDEKGVWDYKRTCVEGPVFDAKCIEW